MSKTLKVGLIGVGGIARVHVPGWEASEHAELVAGCDINAEILADWGQQNGVSRLTTDPADLFSDPDIDIIDICTPNMTHRALVVAALEAGKHVICEKPLAPTPEDVQAMIEARDRSGKLLMTAQHFRFHGASLAMKAEIDTGTLGDVYHARSWMLRRSFLVPTPTFTVKANSGGGPCIDIGVHALDLTLWLMGNPQPVTVSGVARAEIAHLPGSFSTWRGGTPIEEPFDVEDFAAAMVRFDNGATLMLEMAWLLHHKTNVEDMQIWLYGNRGGCHWPSAEFLGSNYQTRQHYNRTLTLTKSHTEPHALECMEFARAIAEGAPSPVPPEQSMQVMTILDGIYRSQAAGREVDLRTV